MAIFTKNLRVGIKVNGMPQQDGIGEVRLNDGPIGAVVSDVLAYAALPERVKRPRQMRTTVAGTIPFRPPNFVPLLFGPSRQRKVVLQLGKRPVRAFG